MPFKEVNKNNKFYSFKNLSLRSIPVLFIFLQLVPIIGWLLAGQWLPLRDSFSFLGTSAVETWQSPFIWSRANFDGVHYISIARCGYGFLQEAFFPFYPSLIKVFQRLVGSYSLGAIVISSIAFLLSLIIFKDLLIDNNENQKTIKNTLLWLVIFPTSFYFVFAYSESLFLFLIMSAFWFAGKKRWLLAGIMAGFASYTRLVGVFMVPALFYDYYNQEVSRSMNERVEKIKTGIEKRLRPNYWRHFIQTRAEHLKNIGFISLGATGLLKYMLELNRRTGDALKFVRVQTEFGANRTPDRLIMPYQVIWRYLKMIFTVSPQSFIYFNVWFEFLVALLFGFLIIWGWFRYEIKNGWLIFSGLAFLLPSLTGTFSSMPRYVLVCFPCFWVLGKMNLPKWVYGISFGLQMISVMLFVRGYWVA